MHGLHTGVPMRRISLVGVFMLVMLALATHVTVAQADTNTITQTAITSPSDPSYFYDPTDGGVDPTTGATTGFTVTGTTDSTDPTGDAVDIDCYQDGSEYTVLPDVSVNSSGGFSAFVPYEFLEDEYVSCARFRLVVRRRTHPASRVRECSSHT